MFVFALLALAVSMGCGVALISAARVLHEKVQITALGGLVGLALFTTATYAVSTLAGLNLMVIAAVLLVMIAISTIVWLKAQAWQHWWQQPTDYAALILLAILLIPTALLSHRLLFLDEGTLSVGILNAWGDLPWHMANIMNFAEGQTVPPQNPIFAGMRLTYPFLSNFLSAMLVTAGAGAISSVFLPALLLIPCALMLLYGLTVTLTKSRVAAICVVCLFFFAGGTLGWTRLPSDLSESSLGLMEFLTHLPRDYTGNGGDPDGYHFLNPLLSLFLPQRSFLFGIPLALGILLLLTAPRRTHLTYVAAGVLAGLLPLFHGHTVLALVPIILILFGVDMWRPTGTRGEQLQNWMLFVLPAAIIGIPEILYYVRGNGAEGSFFRWGPGWTASDQNLLWFWLKNTGLLIPLIATAFFLPNYRRAKALAVGGLVLFVVANLYLFAPWAWDNFKLFIFWLLLCLPLIGGLLTYLWHHGGGVGKTATVLIVIIHSFTGAIDITKTILPTASGWSEWDAAAADIATRIRDVVPPGQAVVTAPYHNTPVALAGRPMYLGFTGHVWSHGGSPWQREQAIPEFYQGRLAQLPTLSVKYVLVGPVERQRYPELVIASTWQLIAQNQQYQLYQIAAPGNPATP